MADAGHEDRMTQASTPYDRIGGRAGIATLVDRFYDLMESEQEYAALRALHAPDLTPMRGSLTDFLMAWMGGPRDWFEQRPGACIMSAHGKVPGIDRETGEQWIACMTRAAAPLRARDPEFASAMLEALAGMSRAMAARGERNAAEAAA